MQKVTQEEYDAFKLRVINAVMKSYQQAECSHYEMMPSVYLKAFNYNHKIAPIPPELFENQVCKEVAAKTICDMIEVSESPIMCFVTEGHMATVPQDGTDGRDLPRPSQLPEDQRHEVVFLHFEAKELGDYSLVFIKEVVIGETKDDFQIKLIPYKRCNELNEPSDTGANTAAGIFTNFYSKI